ncbi:hypothetical protein HPB52_018599 [Rhipicephalus sanguineus]|uniref:Uncharacterized protein n=1 Tax=Rhipicephalus sanguineus TaxID=34632 RepID=A0A9D4TB92_RHISA|nr:hypothetical protein HPB52_018599 [Rhipicephalus sanguineus]
MQDEQPTPAKTRELIVWRHGVAGAPGAKIELFLFHALHAAGNEGALTSYAGQWADLEGITGCFTAAVFKYRCSCTETHDRPCHIVRHLAAFNEVLFSARMQLREIPGARGELALVSVADSGMHLPEPQDFQSKLGACLMHRLLKFHQCIAALSVTPFHFEKCASLLCDVLPYSRLKRLRLQFWCSPIRVSICATIASLTSLEELECSFFPLVRTSPSLVVLGFHGTSMEEHATNNLLSTNHNLLTHVCHTLEDSGVHDKVSCGVYFAEDNIDLLKCKMFSGLFLVRDVHEDVKTAALLQLPDCSHVTSLVLEIPRGNLAVSSALAEYVQSTSVLRKLEVSTGFADDFDFSDEWWRVIVESLARNNSLKELVFYVDSMSDRDVESIADAVNASRNIRKLTFGDSTVTSLRAFGRLDQGWPEASKKVLAIYEATRRNMGLLAVAAAFTKTTELDRYSSAALERICKLHGELLEDLAELADVSAAEIGGLARGHLKRTASLDEYMRITSVVKERVVCHPRDDGSMQLDDLNEDCWEMVRRCLMLDDVEVAVAHTECR